MRRIRPTDTALTIRLLTGQPAEMAALQCVLEAAPAYFERVTGGPPGGAEAQSTFTALAPGKTYDDKFVWGLYSGDAMIGCADVIRGYPVDESAVIGLLLLAEHWQHRGLAGLSPRSSSRKSQRGRRSRAIASASPHRTPVHSSSGVSWAIARPAK